MQTLSLIREQRNDTMRSSVLSQQCIPAISSFRVADRNVFFLLSQYVPISPAGHANNNSDFLEKPICPLFFFSAGSPLTCMNLASKHSNYEGTC